MMRLFVFHRLFTVNDRSTRWMWGAMELCCSFAAAANVNGTRHGKKPTSHGEDAGLLSAATGEKKKPPVGTVKALRQPHRTRHKRKTVNSSPSSLFQRRFLPPLPLCSHSDYGVCMYFRVSPFPTPSITGVQWL